MTFYLLIVTEDGEDSYSLWKTYQSAQSEMKYLKDKFGICLYSMDIIEVDAYD